MTSHERRLQRLEHAQRWRNLAAAGAPYGLSAHDLLDEAQRYFALSLAEQLAEVDRYEADLRHDGFTDADLTHIREVLIRDYRPMD